MSQIILFLDHSIKDIVECRSYINIPAAIIHNGSGKGEKQRGLRVQRGVCLSTRGNIETGECSIIQSVENKCLDIIGSRRHGTAVGKGGQITQSGITFRLMFRDKGIGIRFPGKYAAGINPSARLASLEKSGQRLRHIQKLCIMGINGIKVNCHQQPRVVTGRYRSRTFSHLRKTAYQVIDIAKAAIILRRLAAILNCSDLKRFKRQQDIASTGNKPRIGEFCHYTLVDEGDDRQSIGVKACGFNSI